MRKYSGLDPAGPLEGHFCDQELARHYQTLQKTEGWDEKPTGELLREAQKVFVGRDVHPGLGRKRQPVASVSKLLDLVSRGRPQCVQAVAATALLVEESKN